MSFTAIGLGILSGDFWLTPLPSRGVAIPLPSTCTVCFHGAEIDPLCD